MYKKERMENILEILREHGYVTVNYLTHHLHYSKATVNRDLNELEQTGQIVRSYGGAELAVPRSVPVLFRYEKSKTAKKKLGAYAASLVRDGETVFIDGSTTAQYMGEHLTDKKGIHVLTNNMALAIFLCEHGIEVTVLGGKICEPPYMLAGNETVEIASHYRADKCFFSTSDVSSGGEMFYEGDIYFSMHRTMLKNSDHQYYLVSSEKVDRVGGKRLLGDFSLVDHVITDHEFSDDVRSRYPKVNFIKIDEE